MSENTPKALELAELIDGIVGSLGSEIAIELKRLHVVEIERDALLTNVADLTLSLGASERRVENHTRMIKGYQDELASLRSELEAARGKVEAEKLPEGKWSLGHRDGNWREIDHADHQALMRIVWRMEDDDGPNHFLESQARAVVAALNDATELP